LETNLDNKFAAKVTSVFLLIRLNLLYICKEFCFGAIPDIMIELIATKQAVMTVPQWHRNQIIRGLWLLANKI
jgi:hypothetical protein